MEKFNLSSAVRLPACCGFYRLNKLYATIVNFCYFKLCVSGLTILPDYPYDPLRENTGDVIKEMPIKQTQYHSVLFK